MQHTADCHHQNADALLTEVDRVFATELDTAVPMLNLHPAAGEPLIHSFLRRLQFLVVWFLGRHKDLYLIEPARQEAEIRQQLVPSRQG